MSGIFVSGPHPIGEPGDISQRMAEALEQADFIAAEGHQSVGEAAEPPGPEKADGLPLPPQYRDQRPGHFGAPAGGESCALVTDAGMPAISGPRGGAGRPVRRPWGDGDAHPGPMRPGDCPGGLRPAHGPVYLRGLPLP